jgi:hypothetical protein
MIVILPVVAVRFRLPLTQEESRLMPVVLMMVMVVSLVVVPVLSKKIEPLIAVVKFTDPELENVTVPTVMSGALRVPIPTIDPVLNDKLLSLGRVMPFVNVTVPPVRFKLKLDPLRSIG